MLTLSSLLFLAQVSAIFNIQIFLQWLVAGGISFAAVMFGLKSGVKDLQEKFEKLDKDVSAGFANIKEELDKLKDTQGDVSQRVALLEYRVDEQENKKAPVRRPQVKKK